MKPNDPSAISFILLLWQLLSDDAKRHLYAILKAAMDDTKKQEPT